MAQQSQANGPSWIALLGLACLDAWRDKRISICMIAAVISVIAPLLLLLGLKNGVVTQMRHELTSQPQNLELRMVGSHQLDQDWFDRARSQPATSFVVPLTRSLNTVGDLRASARAFITHAELIPSATNDPLLKGQGAPTGLHQAWLSASAASKLDLSPGDVVTLLVARKRNNQAERLSVKLQIIGVLTPAAFGRAAALISPELLTILEDFRDGKQAPVPGVLNEQAKPQLRHQYPRARLYAKRIEDVPTLAHWLADQGIETVSRLADIQAIQAIDRLLQLLFNVIAWLGVIGCTASLIGAFAANVDRKRRDLALLRLIGYGRRTLFSYILVQAIVLSSIGFLVGFGLYGVASHLFDILIGQTLPSGQYVSHLDPRDLLAAALVTVLVAFAVALVGGKLAMGVNASEALRDSG